MKIIVPYNEILPKRSAHDLYLFNLCRQLAKTNMVIELVCGKGSLDQKSLFAYYGEDNTSLFSLRYLPIIRKNNFLGLSWNYVFFSQFQKFLKRNGKQGDFVHLSVLKQAYYHLKRKIPGIKYIYEAHELAFYGQEDYDPKKLRKEKFVFNKADLVIVTTNQLKNILSRSPYSITRKVEVIPLSGMKERLPPPPKNSPLTLCYIGQLYDGQGIECLLKALSLSPLWKLKIIGGKKEEITYYQEICEKLQILKRVFFYGFCEPKQIPDIAVCAHAFVAPFENKGRMPFVAHTKLGEYATLGRPILAPDLPITQEHFPKNKGVLLFAPGNPQSLARALDTLSEDETRGKLQAEILEYEKEFCFEKRALRYTALLQN